MRRTLTRITAVLGLAATVLGGQSALPPAQAATATAAPPTAVALTLQNVATGTIADLSGGQARPGQAILEWNYNNAANQQWWLAGTGGHYKIKSNVNGAYCMARQGDGNLQNVVLADCAAARTDWDFEDLGGDKYKIKDPAGPYYLNVWNWTATPGRGLVTSTVSDYGGAYWFLTGLDVPRRAMPADPRLDQVTFLTTHNAFANTDEGFWGRFPNQSYSLRSQLDQGIRGLQLDIYAYRGGVYMCHGSCWGNERTLTAGLRDVVNFLNANPREIVTVFLEDYTTPDQLRPAVNAVSGIGNLIFNPATSGVRSNGWPRVSQLISSNKRLLILSQRSGREDFGVMFDQDWEAENYWSLGNSGTAMECYTRWGGIPLSKEEPGFVRLHVTNHYRDIPTESAASSDNGGKLRDRVQRYCGPAARRKPNYVAVDFFQKPGDGSTWNLIRDMNTYW